MEDDKLRTIDCLRGRLLAERVASKAAKEEADKLAKRLQELEGKLAEEIKCRDRAERKLKKAIKKLESISVLGGNRQMEMPSSSVSSSSSQCFSGPEYADMGRCGLQDVEMRPCSLGSEDLIRGDDASGSSMGESARRVGSQDDNKLAMVPVGEQLVDRKDNVQGVLLALRNAKEQLIQSIRMRADIYSSRDYFAYQRIKLPSAAFPVFKLELEDFA